MQVFEYKKGVRLNIGRLAVALGFFDGVHMGHRELLLRTGKIAREGGLGFAVFTFRSESLGVKSDGRLYSTESKLGILSSLGADAVIVADFPEVCDISAESFVADTLISDVGASVAVAGYDFRFGRGAAGDVRLLEEVIRRHGGECITVEEQTFLGEKVSTTRIKALLSEGRVKEANLLLTEPYFISGRVSHGKGLGRTLGFPTVNIPIEKGFFAPRPGVYYSRLEIGGKSYTGLTNIGYCPTFGSRELHAEVFILDFFGEIYGDRVEVKLLDFIRDEKRFKDAEELKMQINVDINKVKDNNFN